LAAGFLFAMISGSAQNHSKSANLITMKKIATIVGALLFAPLMVNAQLTLNSGDTFEYSFNSLPETRLIEGPFLRGAGFLLQLDTSTMGVGDTVRIEMFEEGILGTAPVERVVDLAGQTEFVGAGFGAPPDMWTDFDGSVRVTAVSGSFTINQMIFDRAEATPNDDTLTQRLTITPVPEPSTIALGILGAAALLYRSRK
jgi:hypothetical protein